MIRAVIAGEQQSVNNEMESRRVFLSRLAFLLGCQVSGAKVLATEDTAYKIAPWTGDDFTLGHRLRANDLPAFSNQADKKIDFVIVGGGMSALAAAYKLKDHDFLLLEQYDELGGQSRGGSHKGIDYSWGPAYIYDLEGIYGQLYSELGLSPVKLEPDRNAWRWQDSWLRGVQSENNLNLNSQFKRLLEESKQAIASDSKTGDNKLDKTLFSSCLASYEPGFISLVDSYCRSAFCGGINQISAYAGYWLMSGLSECDYVFKGGNPAIARAMANKVKAGGRARCETGAFVWRIDLKENSASVIYSSKDGSLHRVDCRHVIVTAPPFVSWRLMPQMPDQLKAQLMQFKFGSYLVANMLLKKPVFEAGYDSYVGAPFSFADVIIAETPYIKSGCYKPEMGSVLTIYQPYPAGSDGRNLLFVGDRDAFASSLVKQMSTLASDLSNNLEEIVLTRWGHAMAIVGPNYNQRLEKIKPLIKGPFSLAHSSMDGGQCAESAIKMGYESAQRALSLSAQPGIVVL